jgi:hypothetical protein
MQPPNEPVTPTPTPTPTPAREYEFDDTQNRVIDELSGSMQWVAAPLLWIGILYGIATVVAVVHVFREPQVYPTILYTVLGTVLFLALGKWTGRSADSFAQIVTTKGRDVGHLMRALDELRKMYGLLATFVKVYVALVLIAVLVLLVTAIVRAF